MKNVLIGLFCSITLLLNAQDWTGFYQLKIDKEGYQATLKMQLYQVSGEYWGELRASGNANFGNQWAVEFWTLVSDNTIHCYYDKGNSTLFPENNAHLFSLVKNDNGLMTTFGEAFLGAIKHLDNNNGFKADGTAGKIPEMTSVSVASATSSVNNATSATTKADLILGNWTGEPASDFTKYFDYEFRLDGTGNRGNLTFNWAITEKNGESILELEALEEISRGAYQKLLAEMTSMEVTDSYNILITPDNKRHKVRVTGNNYYKAKDKETYIIAELGEKKLTLKVKDSKGRWYNTEHAKE